MDYETFLFLGFLGILVASAIPIPFLIYFESQSHKIRPLIPYGCFESHEDYVKYVLERCRE